MFCKSKLSQFKFSQSTTWMSVVNQVAVSLFIKSVLSSQRVQDHADVWSDFLQKATKPEQPQVNPPKLQWGKQGHMLHKPLCYTPCRAPAYRGILALQPHQKQNTSEGHTDETEKTPIKFSRADVDIYFSCFNMNPNCCKQTLVSLENVMHRAIVYILYKILN